MVANIVPTNVNYTSDLLRQNLIDLIHTFPFLNIQIVGNSVLGKPIHVIKLGNGNNKVFYSASFHANEWITSVILMKFIEDYSNAYVENKTLYGYSIKNLFKKTSIFLMPMVNPDGVDLVTSALPSNSVSYEQVQKIAYGFATIPFPDGWKANIRGESLTNFHYFVFKNNVVLFYISIIYN